MNRRELEEFISSAYGVDAEYPWARYPGNAVFRHRSNQKWFALVMDIPKSKLGLEGEGSLDVLNLKCDPLLIGSLREERGFFPAYHMSKTSWMTVALDGSVEDEKLKWLLGLSYDLTGVKKKRRQNS